MQTGREPCSTLGVGFVAHPEDGPMLMVTVLNSTDTTSRQIGTLITSQFGPIGDGQGIECFSNYALTPAIRITPDVQYVVPALRSAEPALIAGVRGLVSF